MISRELIWKRFARIECKFTHRFLACPWKKHTFMKEPHCTLFVHKLWCSHYGAGRSVEAVASSFLATCLAWRTCPPFFLHLAFLAAPHLLLWADIWIANLAARCALILQEIEVRLVDTIRAFVLIVWATWEHLRSRRIPILSRRAARVQFGRACGHRLGFHLALHLLLLAVGIVFRFFELAIQLIVFRRQLWQFAESMILLSAVLKSRPCALILHLHLLLDVLLQEVKHFVLLAADCVSIVSVRFVLLRCLDQLGVLLGARDCEQKLRVLILICSIEQARILCCRLLATLGSHFSIWEPLGLWLSTHIVVYQLVIILVASRAHTS